MAITDLFHRVWAVRSTDVPHPKHLPRGTLLNWKPSFMGTRMFWRDAEGKLHSGDRPKTMPWWYQGETYEQAVARVKKEEADAHRDHSDHRPARRKFSDVFSRKQGRKQEVPLRSSGRSLRHGVS